MANPSRARRSEYQALRSTTTQMGVSEVRLSGSNSRPVIVHTCGIALSEVRGRTRQPSTLPPVSGPSDL